MGDMSYTLGEVKALCRATAADLEGAFPGIEGMMIETRHDDAFGRGEFTLMLNGQAAVIAEFDEEYFSHRVRHTLGEAVTTKHVEKLDLMLRKLIDKVRAPRFDPDLEAAAEWLDQLDIPDSNESLSWMGGPIRSALDRAFSQGPCASKDALNTADDGIYLRVGMTSAGGVRIVEAMHDGEVVLQADSLDDDRLSALAQDDRPGPEA